MKSQLSQLGILTVASLKMYYRNLTAVFFSLFIPIFIIVIFGLLTNNQNNKISLGVVDEVNNTASRSFIQAVSKTSAFTVTKGNYTNEMNRLKNGDETIVLVLPSSFGATNLVTVGGQDNITSYYDKAKAQSAEPAFLILNTIIARYNEQVFAERTGHQIPQPYSITTKGIETNNLNEIDFLIPGIAAFSIMQLGLFSVAFAFTSMKKTGALKRLQATPARPLNFIISQVISRLILGVVQTLILVYLGMAFFHFHMYGSAVGFLVLTILGSIVFLSFGFAIAGYSKDENQAAPITNLVSFPMMFLSGVFFPTNGLPSFIKTISSFLPLTYFSDGLRQIANNGAGFTALQGDILGLVIWAVIGLILAVRFFKWE